MEAQDLVVPVYLNQRIVFDLVAMLQGGISRVTRVFEEHSSIKQVEGEVGATAGLNKALSSLLRIDFSSKIAGTGGRGSAESRSEERVHTPVSLFFTLRKIMQERNFINDDLSIGEVSSGDFLEFSASLKRNPIIETMDSIQELMDLASAFTIPEKKSSAKGEAKKILKQIRSFNETLKAGDTLDLITDILPSEQRCVLTLEVQYLNDPAMSDLVDGTFRVLGKVIRYVGEAEEPISLVRKTALSKIPKAMRKQLLESLAELSKDQEFEFPEIYWEVEGPAIHVLPIAIFA